MTILKPFAIVFLLAVPFLAHAGTASASFQVSLRVVNGCAISASPLKFPDYNPRSAGVSGQGQVSLTCTKGAPVTVYIDGEQVLHDATGHRVAFSLTGPDGKPWNETTGVGAIGQGQQEIQIPVKGNVRGGQGAPVGEYSQTMGARVVF